MEVLPADPDAGGIVLLQCLHVVARVEPDPGRLHDTIDAALSAISTR